MQVARGAPPRFEIASSRGVLTRALAEAAPSLAAARDLERQQRKCSTDRDVTAAARAMPNACAPCCGSKPKGVGDDESDDAGAPAPNSLRHVSATKTKRTAPKSLRNLVQYGAGDERDASDDSGAEKVEDDPRAQYETATTPAGKPKFDPNKFKKRVGDHLAAKRALEAERRPLLEETTARVGVEPEDEKSERRAKREERERRKEAKRAAKEDKQKQRARVLKARSTQRRCWWILMIVVLVVIVCAGIIFGDDVHFNYWRSNTDRVDARDDSTQTHAIDSNQMDERPTTTEDSTDVSRAGLSLADGPKSQDSFDDDGDDGDDSDEHARALDVDGDEYGVDFNDPSLRTMAPKAWRRRERDLEKVKRRARSSAKDDVQRFVEGAHRELGVRDEEKDAEEEYEDTLIERIESSPGVVIEKRRGGEDASRSGDKAAEVLAKSQASILSHGLIRDTKSSSRDLDRLSFGDDVAAGGTASPDSRAAAAGEAPTAGEASKTKRAADIKDDDSDPDFGLSAVFRPPNEPVVHERQPDDDGAFSAALPRRVPRRALAA